MNSEWHRVSKHEPCPICQHTDWCMLSNDGNVAVCQRVESDRPTKNSGGWVHRLKKTTNDELRIMNDGGVNPTKKVANSAIHNSSFVIHNSSPDIAAYFAALPTTKDNLQTRMCEYLQRELGLPKEILLTLDWRWDHKAKAVAIPMRDAEGVVTGIRYRALKSGAKWAKRGSKDGLFFDPNFVPRASGRVPGALCLVPGASCLVPGASCLVPGANAQSTKHQAQSTPDEIMVCEGPTDQAAAMACGFWCIGRSSCATGLGLIRAFAERRRIHRVTIFSDFDKPKPRPGGGTWCPGQEGAERLGRELRLPYRIVYPPTQFKDLREWYRTGTLTPESLDQAVKGASWQGPR